MEPTTRNSTPGTNGSTRRYEVVRLSVQGARLDTSAGKILLRDAETAFRAGVDAVVIDLSTVGYMDSVGVAALAAIKRRAPSTARVVLAAMTPYVQTVARVTHLAQVFDVYATVDAAMRALQS